MLLGFVSIIIIIVLIYVAWPRKKPIEIKQDTEFIKESVSIVDIPFHPDEFIKSKMYLPKDTAKKLKVEYYPALSRIDILELKKLGVDARSATKQWVKGKSLDHLPKEKVFIMLRDSYWWERYWKDRPLDFLMFKGIEWVLKGDFTGQSSS